MIALSCDLYKVLVCVNNDNTNQRNVRCDLRVAKVDGLTLHPFWLGRAFRGNNGLLSGLHASTLAFRAGAPLEFMN
jgi:hypothetical protein